jgi:hypothetical protein
MQTRKRAQRADESTKVSAPEESRRARRDQKPIKNIVLALRDADFGGVEWYCSHVDPDVILWSSEPNVRSRCDCCLGIQIVVPTVHLNLPIPEHATPERGNMFIVKGAWMRPSFFANSHQHPLHR